MSVLDIILAAILLFGLIRGWKKGLFVEVTSLVALVAGVYGAIHFSNFAVSFLKSKVDWSEQTINILAFVITFIIIVIAIALAGKALTKLADFASLGLLNKLLGSLFGVLKWGVILSVVLLIFNRLNETFTLVDDNIIEESILYKPVKSVIPMLFSDILEVED